MNRCPTCSQLDCGYRAVHCPTCDAWHAEGYPNHCSECGDYTLNDPMADGRMLCFLCYREASGASSGPYVSIEVGAEDSTDRRRIMDGTAFLNAGLPGVDTVVGKRADGKDILDYRPISNNELSTARSLREYAKRHGLEPKFDSFKRAVGGR